MGIIFDNHPVRPARRCRTIGSATRSARTTCWAAFPWNTRARSFRRRTLGGTTTDDLADFPRHERRHRGRSRRPGSSFSAEGGDWSDISAEAAQLAEERIVVNLGPVHPSTHGVYCASSSSTANSVREIRGATGFPHTGIEKNMEYRT